MEALRGQDATLYERFRAAVGSEPRDDRSVFLYTRLLKCMGTPKRLMKFFNLCDNLSAKRNHIAHRMYAMTEAEFIKTTDRKPESMEKEIESAIGAVYPACDNDVFALHERALSYIEGKR